MGRGCLLLLLVALASSARATNSIRIEAEDYIAIGNSRGCGIEIARHDCESASGGLAVDGVDCDGEWIRLPVTLYRSIACNLGLRSAGSIGYARSFAVQILRDDGQTPAASDTLVTPRGQGVG